MAEGVNRVMLLGNLCNDPELRFTRDGTAVLNIRLATNEGYVDRNKERKERTEYHNVVIWGKRAEGLAKILHKGSAIFVEGSLRTSSYEDRDGNKRYKTEVNASNVVLAGGKRGGGDGQDGGEQRDEPPPSNGSGYRRSPSGSGGGEQRRQEQPAPQPADPGDYTDYGTASDDDIPF